MQNVCIISDTIAGFTYKYFLKVGAERKSRHAVVGNHLGNTRVSFTDNNGTAMRTQEDSYYPYGMRQGGLSYSNGVENKYLYNPESLRFSESLDFRGSPPADAVRTGSKNNANLPAPRAGVLRFAVFRDGKELQDDDLGGVKLGWSRLTSRISDNQGFRFVSSGNSQKPGSCLYDYGARFYDAALGRGTTPDPLAQYSSRYIYVGNNPILKNDPTGLLDVDVVNGSTLSPMQQDLLDSRNYKLWPYHADEDYHLGKDPGIWTSSSRITRNSDNNASPGLKDYILSLWHSFISQFSLTDNKAILYKKYGEGDPSAVKEVQRRNIANTIVNTEVSPYLSLSVGKQTAENYPLSGWGSLTLTGK